MAGRTVAPAHCADDGVKSRLWQAFAAIEAASTSGDRGTLLAATTSFYEIIFRAAGHEIAWEVVQRLNGRISRLRALTLATSERRVSGPARMARICEAIAANDADAAGAAVREHLTEASEIARRLLDAEAGGH